MSNLNQESTILSSNDGSITLTTHRLLQRTREINKEIMLTDFLAYEQIQKRSNYFKILTMIFFLIATLLIIVYTVKGNEAETFRGRFDMAYRNSLSEHMSVNEQLQLYGGLAGLFSFLFGISLVIFLLSKRKFLRIVGKFSTIEFSSKHLSDYSFSKFTNALITESDNRKRDL